MTSYFVLNFLMATKQSTFSAGIKKILYSIQKFKSIQEQGNKSLRNPIILGTYIGEQVKKYLNEWINAQKADLILQTSKDVKLLINMISNRNNQTELYKIKYLIRNNKNLQSSDIKKILQSCGNLFYMTALQLQGNDLTQQFKSLKKLKYFRHLEQLNLNDTGINNKDIQLLKQFKYLGKLEIAGKNGSTKMISMLKH